MKQPYITILLVSIVLVVLYFLNEDQSMYIDPVQDRREKLLYGAIYIVLIFSTLSLMYLYYKQSKKKRW
ncbi:MAG: hypothetical protein V4649_02145 [Bacteroidota bacterium]